MVDEIPSITWPWPTTNYRAEGPSSGFFVPTTPEFLPSKNSQRVFFCRTGCNQIIGKTQFPAGSYKIEKKFHDSCFKKIILPWKLLYSRPFFWYTVRYPVFWKVIIIWNLDQLNHFQNCFKIFLGKNTKRQFIISLKDKAPLM